MRQGRGSTLGQAIIAAYGVLRRRPALSWSAQLSQLTMTGRGQEILARHASPGPAARKWRGWLSREHTPNSRSRESIDAAYREYIGHDRGAIDHGREGHVYGKVTIHDHRRGKIDSRDRRPLVVKHAGADEDDWEEFDEALRSGDPQQVEDAYAGRIMGADDNLAWSYAPVFDGPSYVFALV